MSTSDTRGLADLWPPDGRLARLHRRAIARRVARGELRTAAELHAIAETVVCATPAERALMLATSFEDDQ